MATNWTAIFTDFGKIVLSFNDTEAFQVSIDSNRDDFNTVFGDTAERQIFMTDLMAALNSVESGKRSTKSSMVSRCKDYITGFLNPQMEGTHSNVTDILADMVIKMVDDSETVNGCDVTAIDNGGDRTGNEVMAGLAADQLAIDDEIRVECISAGTEGAERWSVNSQALNGSVGTATTGSAYSSNGITFTINRKTAVINNDGDSQIGGISIFGMVKSVNCDASEKIYPKLTATGGTMAVELYKDSGLASVDLIAHISDVTATVTDVALIEDSDSDVSGTIDITKPGGGFVTDVDINIDVPTKSVVGDQFLITTTTDDAGVFLKFFRDEFSLALPADLVGGETISDTLAT